MSFRASEPATSRLKHRFRKLTRRLRDPTERLRDMKDRSRSMKDRSWDVTKDLDLTTECPSLRALDLVPETNGQLVPLLAPGCSQERLLLPYHKLITQNKL